jgi:hypothetical protein
VVDTRRSGRLNRVRCGLLRGVVARRDRPRCRRGAGSMGSGPLNRPAPRSPILPRVGRCSIEPSVPRNHNNGTTEARTRSG